MFKIINDNNLNSNLKPLSSSVYKMLLPDIKRLILNNGLSTVLSESLTFKMLTGRSSRWKEGGREEKRT